MSIVRSLLVVYIVSSYLRVFVTSTLVQNFVGCTQFFDLNGPPIWVRNLDPTRYVTLCQRRNNQSPFVYATLYDKVNRMPIFSAYTLNAPINSGGVGSRSGWITEDDLTNKEQLSNDDYNNIVSLYHKGHLAPYSFFPPGQREATNILTNAVPQEKHNNNRAWKSGEIKIRKNVMATKCQGGRAFIITGVIPYENQIIASQSVGKFTYSIPTHIYTAVCCRISSGDFSFGYIIRNADTYDLDVYDTQQLANIIQGLWKGRPGQLQFFQNCNSNTNSNPGKKLFEELYKNYRDKRVPGG